MSTDIKLILKAQEVPPRDVLHATTLPEAGSLIVLDCGSLRRQVEWFKCERHLTWEEWIDLRDSWCKRHRAVLCSTTRGDKETIKRVAEQGMRQGYHYLLLEIV